MKSQVTIMANFDVITIVYRGEEPRTIVACHILKKNLNGNTSAEYDTSAEYAVV